MLVRKVHRGNKRSRPCAYSRPIAYGINTALDSILNLKLFLKREIQLVTTQRPFRNPWLMYPTKELRREEASQITYLVVTQVDDLTPMPETKKLHCTKQLSGILREVQGLDHFVVCTGQYLVGQIFNWSKMVNYNWSQVEIITKPILFFNNHQSTLS